MNRLSDPLATTGLSMPLRAMLVTTLLALSVGEAAAVPAWDDPIVEPAMFEQDFPMSEDLANPARSVVDLTDNQISEALFKSSAELADSTILLAGFDPLQTP